jgi:hypothetical protein
MAPQPAQTNQMERPLSVCHFTASPTGSSNITTGIALNDISASHSPDIDAMGAILFTCPSTRLTVQHWLDDDEYASEDDYEGVMCPACSRVHFVNRDGRVLGGDGDHWTIHGREFVNCNCSYGCPCQFDGLPTSWFLPSGVGMLIEKGHHGSTPTACTRRRSVISVIAVHISAPHRCLRSFTAPCLLLSRF